MTDNNTAARSGRYRVIIKTHFLIILGYFLVTIETLIAKIAGFIKISYSDVLHITITFIGGTAFILLFLLLKKTINRKIEKLFFAAQLVLYIVLFNIWMYYLRDMRPFALFSSLFAIIIVLSYTNLKQSLLISASTLISFFIVSYYTKITIGQDSNFARDMFYAFCFIPTTVFISIIANANNKKNKELKAAKERLEATNDQLSMLNCELERAQKMTKIELELAHDIQKSLFLEKPLNTGIWDIALFFRPRYGVSGDFYDFYYEEGKLKGLSIFDVSGHGIASALITFMAKPIFNRYFNLLKNEPLGRVIEIANDTMRKDLNTINMYITGILLRFKNDEIEYINAGHPDILYKEKNTGRINILSGTNGKNKFSPIGLIDSVLSCRSVKLLPQSGDVMLLYTDCITESNNIINNRYGHERLIQSLEEAPDGTAGEILDYLLKRFYLFLEEKDIDDDFTAILIKKL